MTFKLATALFSALALLGCRSAPVQPPPVGVYTLVLIRTGPNDGTLDADARRAAFAGHFANMERMAQERQLLLAGPYGATKHAGDLRGLFVLDTSDLDEAAQWAASDPTTQSGVFVLEHHTLATAMPLGEMLEAELDRLAELEAAGATPQPGQNARAWVLLTAEHGDVARRELEPLVSPDGGVFLLGELDGERLWAVLDARDAAQARERFAPELAAMGAHTLDDWFATDLIAMLVR
ncbi:MAG TPA: YciI family protein [Planctomycetota bacterium]|nr:YciI family protein [Planctomycetota bacterium]